MDPKTAPAETPEAPEQTPEAQGPKYLTSEEFNRATSARDKRLTASLEKMLEAKLASLMPKPKDPEEVAEETPAQAAPQGAQAKPADPMASELAKLRKRLEASEKTAADERAAREAQTAKAMRDEERSTLSAALAAEGITGVKAKALISLLHSEEKRVIRDSEGRIAFVNADNEPDDFGSGLKAWLATDEGKAFLPARGVQGTNTPVGKAPNKVAGKNARAEARAALGELLFKSV